MSFGVALSALLVGLVRPAQADGAGFTWERGRGAETCIDGEELHARAIVRLGRDPFVGASRALVAGSIERSTSRPRWRARIVALDAFGTELGARELTSDRRSCHALDEALALVVALMAEQASTARSPADQTIAQAPASPAVVIELGATPIAVATVPARPRSPAVSRVSEELDTPGPRLRMGAALGVTVDAGTLPSATMGVALRVGIDVDERLAIALSGARFFSRGHEAGGGTTQFGLTQLGAELCPRLVHVGIVSGSACLGAGVQWVSAKGEGFQPSLSSLRWTLEVGAGLRLRFQLTSALHLGLAVSGRVPVERDRYVVEMPRAESVAIHQPSLVSVRSDVFFGVAWP